MGCQYIYNDVDGKPSIIYQRALKKYGPERAEELYIRHMMSKLDTRFSAGRYDPLYRTLDDRASAIKDNDNGKTYTRTDGKELDRVTALLDKFTMYSVESNQTLQQKLLGIIPETKLEASAGLEIGKERLAKELLGRTLPAEQQKADVIDANIKLLIDANPQLLIDAKKDITTLWEYQNTWGTKIHGILAEVSTQWEILADTADAKGTSLTIGNLTEAIENAKLAVGFTELSTASLKAAFAPIYQFILDQGVLVGQRLILKPELRVWTDKFKAPNSINEGIGGTIDLLIQTKDKSHTYTGDFKTKAFNKAKEFSKTSGKGIGQMFHPPIPDSPETRAEAQQLLYALVLSDPAYNIHVDGNVTFVLPFDFEEDNITLGSKTYKVSHVRPAVVGKLKDTGTALESIRTYFTEGDLKVVYEKARVNGIAGTVESWSGKDENGVPNSTFSKEHKASYIANKLISKKTVDGKLVIYMFTGKPVDVTGKSDDEIKVILNDAYDAAHDLNVNIAGDIVTWFYDPEKAPKHLLSRTTAIRTLLKDISPSTHTLEVAQGHMQAFYGIGPDVLIAKNRRTGAITLLSAVTTVNNPIKFRTDGSKEKRTTMFGNFKTDDEVVSGSLNEELMYEPKSHDFLAMKLGMAALYLQDKYKEGFKLDRMRIVTMGMGQSVEFTDTFLDMELEKLKEFRKVAGSEFPTNIAALLDNFSMTAFKGSETQHLKNLMIAIFDNSDPLSRIFQPQLKEELKTLWDRYNSGDKLCAWELKSALGNYLQAVAKKFNLSMSDEQIMNSPAFVAVAKALAEFAEFDLSLKDMAKQHITVAAINSAVNSGDKNLMRFHVEYNAASNRIRKEMDGFSKEHKLKYEALLKAKGLDFIGNTDKAFGNMYKKTGKPEDFMSFKDEDDSTLIEAEREYIKYFNKEMLDVLLSVTHPRYREDIKNGRFWTKGDIPIIHSQAEFLKEENFKSWIKLKNTVSAKLKSMQKKTKSNTAKSFLIFDFGTKFDQQAIDEGVGHSKLRRKALGLADPNSPVDPDENIERNPALILNMAKLEAAEKSNYQIILQELVAMQSILISESDRTRTGMTLDMINVWRDLTIFNQYEDEPMSKFTDPLNRISSELLFAYSIRQIMIEASTGTLQTGSLLIANSIQNAYAEIFKRPDMAGRFTTKEWAKAVNAWNRYNPITNQMVYDCGILQADADDLRTEEFKAGNKVNVFQSEAAFWMNRLFFNSALTHTFLAQVYHLGIDKAYVRTGKTAVYDETLDPRFFAYDEENKIGDKAPVTEDEQKRYSVWVVTREDMAKDGSLDPKTKRMLVPLTSNQRAEMKQYATRAYGSFNKDNQIHGEAFAIMRSMVRYRKWAFQKVANYWTPTIHDSPMYGHWNTVKDADGKFVTTWVGDDFQGIIQTLGFMTKEIAALRAKSMIQTLNKYQLENLSKLMSDLILFFMMILMILPFFADTTDELNEETGEVKKVKGDFGKSIRGDNIYKASLNATSDLFFVTGIKNLTSNMFPAFSMYGQFGGKVLNGLGELLQGKETAGETLVGSLDAFGIPRSFNIIAQPLTGK